MPNSRKPGRLGWAPVSEDQGYDDAVLPAQTSDDTDRGWGEDRSGRDEDDGAGWGDGTERDEGSADERLVREKPPHW